MDADEEDWRTDPNLPLDLVVWAKTKTKSKFLTLASQLGVFSEREIARKVHLMYVLNIVSTLLGGFFNRNEKTLSLLDDYKESFEAKDTLYSLLDETLQIVQKLNLDNQSFWSQKANFFTLVVAIAKRLETGALFDLVKTQAALALFASQPPNDYALAAREAVNNRKERQLRNQHVSALLVT